MQIKYPIFQPGDPQLRVYLPLFWVSMLHPGKNSPKRLLFRVHPQMTPEDVKQYIEKIYQVKILQVTTEEIRNEMKSAEEEVNLNMLTARSPYLSPPPPERFARIARVTLAPPYTFEFPDIASKVRESQTKQDETLKAGGEMALAQEMERSDAPAARKPKPRFPLLAAALRALRPSPPLQKKRPPPAALPQPGKPPWFHQCQTQLLRSPWRRLVTLDALQLVKNQRMEQKFYEFGCVRVGGERGVESFYHSEALLASPLAMPSAGFTFSSFVADPLEFPLAAPDDLFASLALGGPNSPASSTHSASTPPVDLIPPVQKPVNEMGQDLGAFDFEGLSAIDFPLISALESTYQLPVHVTFEKVQPQFTAFQLQPISTNPSGPTTSPPPPSVSAFSENDFSSASSAQGDPSACIDEFTTDELFEIMRSLNDELPPQDVAPVDTSAMGAAGYVSMSNAFETIVSSAPIQTAPIQAAQPAGFGSVIVPNNLLAALPKSSSPDTKPTAAAPIVLTQQQLKELILPEDTLIVLKPDGGHLVLGLASDVTLQSLTQPQPQPQSVTVAAPTHDVTQSVARQKATLPARQRVMSSAPLVTAPRYQELVTVPRYRERVRPRNESVSDKSEGGDPTWTPDEQLDYAAPSRSKRMPAKPFSNLNEDDALDELEYEAGSTSEVSSYMKPVSPAKSPQKSLQKAGAKETGARSGRKSQAVPANRKERKRQQNREAAARYRQKKHAEHEGVEFSIEDMEAHNAELRQQVERASRECEAFKKTARLLFGPAFDRMMAEARAQASAASKSAHTLVHHAKF